MCCLPMEETGSISHRRETAGGAGFSYLALGHIHKPHALLRGKAVYAGALEPIDRNDTGKHGYVEDPGTGGNSAEIYSFCQPQLRRTWCFP